MNSILNRIKRTDDLLRKAEKELEIIIDCLYSEEKDSFGSDIDNDVLENVICARCRLSEVKDQIFGFDE